MSDYQLTITNHPAIADDPTRPGKKLFKDGEPVPLFPKQRMIRFNGKGVAFVSKPAEELKLLFYGFGGTLPEQIKQECVELAEQEFNCQANPANVITPKQPAPIEDDE